MAATPPRAPRRVVHPSRARLARTAADALLACGPRCVPAGTAARGHLAALLFLLAVLALIVRYGADLLIWGESQRRAVAAAGADLRASALRFRRTRAADAVARPFRRVVFNRDGYHRLLEERAGACPAAAQHTAHGTIQPRVPDTCSAAAAVEAETRRRELELQRTEASPLLAEARRP